MYTILTASKSPLTSLETKLGAAPVPSLGVVPDGVAGAEADPLGDRAVLALLFGKLLLGAKRFVGRHLVVLLMVHLQQLILMEWVKSVLKLTMLVVQLNLLMI